MEEKKRNETFKNILTIVTSLLFAGLFMWLALRGLNFDEITKSLEKANYFWVLAAAFFGVLAYWVRAVRWHLLLEPLGYEISNSNSLWSLSFGYLMNLTIPRSGEVARATALYRVEKVPVEKSFGTIITERIVDLLCMGIFLVLTLIFKHKAIIEFYQFAVKQKKDEPKSDFPLAYVLLGFSILILILFFIRKKIKGMLLFVKIRLFLVGLFHGVVSVFRMKQKGKFILLSLGIWICYYLATYLVFFALPETSHLGIADGFFIIVVGTLGMMVPASGGIGAFHFALKLGFMAIGENPKLGGEIGLSYALIAHTMQLVIMLVMGAISVPILAKNKNALIVK